MKRFEQGTSYPYGHLVIDLKSNTPEKDRLHTEIFDKAKTMDEKKAVEKEALVLNMKKTMMRRGRIGNGRIEEEEEE